MIDKKKLADRYPIYQCRDGLYRYETVNGAINLKSKGYKSKSAAAKARNNLQGIPFADDFIRED